MTWDVGTAAGATDIVRQRAVLPAWRASKGMGDCLQSQVGNWAEKGFRSRRSGFPPRCIHFLSSLQTFNERVHIFPIDATDPPAVKVSSTAGEAVVTA